MFLSCTESKMVSVIYRCDDSLDLMAVFNHFTCLEQNLRTRSMALLYLYENTVTQNNFFFFLFLDSLTGLCERGISDAERTELVKEKKENRLRLVNLSQPQMASMLQ